MKNNELNRRDFLRVAGGAGIAGAGTLLASCRPEAPSQSEVPAGPRLARFPEKNELILLTDRPPQLETPLHYFQQDVTPNEAFFVRWHLEGIPTSVDLDTFRLQVGGHVRTPLQLSVDDLKTRFTPVSFLAVNQCSGNARSPSSSRACRADSGNRARLATRSGPAFVSKTSWSVQASRPAP